MKIRSIKEQQVKSVSWEIVKLVLPAILGFGLAYITFSKEYDATEKGRLNDNLNKILDINFQYPFVDDSTFIANWSKNKNSNSDSSLRYQTYCEYIFNFLQDVCEYYKFDRKKIETFVDVEDLIIQHKAWWLSTARQNSVSYDQNLNNFVTFYYNQ